jgi:hypothetical protein
MTASEIQTQSTPFAELVGELMRAGLGALGHDQDVGFGRVE